MNHERGRSTSRWTSGWTSGWGSGPSRSSRSGRLSGSRCVVSLAALSVLGLVGYGCAGSTESAGPPTVPTFESGITQRAPTHADDTSPVDGSSLGTVDPSVVSDGTTPGTSAGTSAGPSAGPSPVTSIDAVALAAYLRAIGATTSSRPPAARGPAPGRPPASISVKHAPTGPGVPPIPSYSMSEQEQGFFACVVERESSGNPYAINWEYGAAGLFQFLQATWDSVARRVGRPDLVEVSPALAPVPLQWWFAHELFIWQGTMPWLADGCQLPPPSPTTVPPGPPSTTAAPAPTTVPSEPPSS